MKKSICFVLCLAMLLSCGALACAESIHNGDNLTDSDSIGVTAGYTASQTNVPTVYYVTVSWEQSGTLTYAVGTTTYTWNPNALTYSTTDTDSAWTIDDAKLTVTVTNRSNAAVLASFGALTAVSGSGVTDITSSRSVESLSIASAATQGQTTEGSGQAQTGSCVYSITAVTGAISEAKTIGTLTVSISAD